MNVNGGSSLTCTFTMHDDSSYTATNKVQRGFSEPPPRTAPSGEEGVSWRLTPPTPISRVKRSGGPPWLTYGRDWLRRWPRPRNGATYLACVLGRLRPEPALHEMERAERGREADDAIRRG